MKASEIAPIHTKHDIASRIITFVSWNEVFNIH